MARTSPNSVDHRRLWLFTLGAPRLDVAGHDGATSRTIGPGKPLALITYLAFAPRRTATRDRLCDLLWGDRNIEQARAQLRQALWQIKAQAGDGLFRTGPEGIALVGDLEIDAHAFSAAVHANDLERAIELYTGEFFAGYAAPGADAFEAWASLERTRLRSLFVHAAESLARRALDAGRFRDAVGLAHRLREAHEHGEIGWRLLLEARIASGDSIGATADADQLEEWLRAEERKPEPATAALLQAARRTVPADQTASGAAVPLAAELVGREKEFAAVYDAWNAAKTKGARCVHVTADSGMGKTRLVLDIAARLRSAGEQALYLRANSGERFIPFSAAAAFAECLADKPGASGVSPATASTLVSLNQSLSVSYPRAASASGQLEPLCVGLALLQLVAAVADENPTAIIVDDLQWCDRASSEALTIVASRLDKEAVLLVVTARARYNLPKLRDDAAAVPLSRLALPDVEQLVGSLARLPETPWAETLPARLLESSRGNPLYVLEALRLCIDRGLLSREREHWNCADPKALSDVLGRSAIITQRLGVLSAAERSVVLVLAVAGTPLPPRIAAEAAGLQLSEAAGVARRLELGGLLITQPDTWRIAHDAIEEAALAGADRQTTMDTHAALGTAMTGTREGDWQRLAVAHFAAAEQWASAASATVQAIRSSPRRGESRHATISRLLGQVRDPASVVRVRRQLPVAIRYPRLLQGGLGTLALVLAAVGVFAASRSPGERPPNDSELLVFVVDADGSARVRRVALDADRWDATRPLLARPRWREERWRRFGAGLHVTPRPGSLSWASYVVHPDSGQGDIELQDGDGQPIRLTRERGEDRPASFAPDGQQLVFLTTRWSPHGWSDLAVLDIGTRAVRRLTSGNGTNQHAYWSPDGVRIAFVRDFFDANESVVCTIDVDGTHERCRGIPNWRVRGLAGWAGDHRVWVEADSSETKAVLILDTDAGSVIASTFPLGGMIALDPTGRWVLVRRDTESGKQSWRVSPVGRFDLAREIVAGDSAARVYARFASPNLPSDFLDSVAIGRPADPLAPGVPHQLLAQGWSRGRKPMRPAITRWRSLTPSIVRIDSLGVLIARDTGDAVIEVSAGGWRVARATIRIRSVPVTTVLEENWTHDPFSRWRAFGDPLPAIVKDGDRHAFLNDGDGNFFSGSYSRTPFEASQGMAVDLELSTPITRPQWQVVVAGLHAFSDTVRLERWDHETGYLGGSLHEGPGCWFQFPQGEGAEAVTRADWFPGLRAAMPDPLFRLDSGAWYRVRLQIFPDGRCGIAINGHPVQIAMSRGPTIAPVHLIVQGSSVGSRILVGPVRVQAGVPTDMDWTELRFDGNAWRFVRDHSRQTRTSRE